MNYILLLFVLKVTHFIRIFYIILLISVIRNLGSSQDRWSLHQGVFALVKESAFKQRLIIKSSMMSNSLVPTWIHILDVPRK